jgi:hypothetical protein
MKILISISIFLNLISLSIYTITNQKKYEYKNEEYSINKTLKIYSDYIELENKINGGK